MSNSSPTSPQEITVEECKQMGNWQLVDVRSATEFASGHIPGAVNIPMDELETRIGDLRADLPVVLICQSGKRAAISGTHLSSHGLDLRLLCGGVSEWERSGQSVICSQKTRWSLERQVRLGAGLIVLTGIALSRLVEPPWIYLSAFAGAGLVFAGLTNVCLMANVLSRMPWNGRK